jgi:glycosyltransferase involved in cell wall biosynthesis
VLIVWSPPPIITRESEKKYRSRESKKPRALPSLADPHTIDLTVVIPAFNERARLPSMLATTVAHLTTSSWGGKRLYEILIVDDGSSDDTTAVSLDLARKYPKVDIRVVTLEQNLGKGGAVRHGMMFGRGKRLLMVDADGASRFEDLELLWKVMDDLVLADDSAPAIVIGSRAHLVKTEAVVKVSYFLHVACRHNPFSQLDSVPSSAMSSCMACMPSSASLAWATFATRNADSSSSLEGLPSRYSRYNISQLGYLTWKYYCWQSSFAFPWRRCL